MLRRTCLALSLLPLASSPTLAQVTADQAASLQDQLRAWVTDLLGPDFPLPAPSLAVTAAGDHYQMSLPLGSAPDSPRLTATLRGPDAGRWTVGDFQYPPTVHYVLDLGQAAGGSITYDITLGGQSGQWVIDPTLQTTSTLTTSFTGVDSHASSERMEQTMHYGGGASEGSIRPSGNGRVTVTTNGHLDDVTLDVKPSAVPPGEVVPPPFQVSVAHGGVEMVISDLDPDRMTQALHLFGTVLKYGNDPARKDDAATAALALLVSLGNIGRGYTIDETVENLHFKNSTTSVALQRARFGFGMTGQDDRVALSFQFGAEGLTLPDTPLGDAAALVPTKFNISPSVSNVPGPALLGLLDRRPGQSGPNPQRIAALFARGPILAGVDDLVLDVAGAELTGHAKVSIANAASFTGLGEFAMTNFDALQQRLSAAPSARQLLPGLVFLKGIGRVEGDRVVWSLDLHDNRLFVNGTDIFALAGRGARPPATRP